MAENMCKKDLSIAVIGGGIGGLCLALGLLRRGIRVDVYERSLAHGETSQGIAFGPNSVRAMHMVDPAIWEDFIQAATHNDCEASEGHQKTWINFRNGMSTDAALIAGVKTSDLDHTGLSSIARAKFLDILARRVPAEVVHFNKQLKNIEELAGGRMLMLFQDGSSAEASAVVGADGARSVCRQYMLGLPSPGSDLEFAGHVVYRALIPMTDAVDAIGADLARNAAMYAGVGGHVLTYPLDDGAIMNVVACINKQSWTADRWIDRDTDYKQMLSDFAGWGEHVRSILKVMARYRPDLWALFGMGPVPAFCKNNLALLGDAAHATEPHQGAGAGQALEDAAVLSALLAEPSVRSPRDLTSVFLAYDTMRRPRSQKVVSTSRDFGRILRFESKAGDDAGQIAAATLGRFNWIWAEDLDVHIQQAVAVLRHLSSQNNSK